MKLLFDHNLSPGLVKRLADLFPNSTHVYLLGLDQADDRAIRDFALHNDFLIVTKDADFSDLCWWLGFPPKVIWIRHGNCKTALIEALLRTHVEDIQSLVENSTVGILNLA